MLARIASSVGVLRARQIPARRSAGVVGLAVVASVGELAAVGRSSLRSAGSTLLSGSERVHAGRLHRGDGGDGDPVADQGVAEQLAGFVADRRAGARDVGRHEVGGHEEQLELRFGEQNVLVAFVVTVAVAAGGAVERGSGDAPWRRESTRRGHDGSASRGGYSRRA